jgi:hypothetical protein
MNLFELTDARLSSSRRERAMSDFKLWDYQTQDHRRIGLYYSSRLVTPIKQPCYAEIKFSLEEEYLEGFRYRYYFVRPKDILLVEGTPYQLYSGRISNVNLQSTLARLRALPQLPVTLLGNEPVIENLLFLKKDPVMAALRRRTLVVTP